MSSKRKKKNLCKKILIVLPIIFVILGILAGSFIMKKLNNLQIQEIDTSDLAINRNLYNEVSDVLSRSEFEKIHTLVLFGTDSRDSNNMASGRSDSIIIVSINMNSKAIKLISIPRDTYVEVPEYGKTKINHAYAYGGEILAIKTINQNFGLNINEYATIDFSGLIHIINEIGGIQVSISKSEMEYINDHVSESYELTNGNVQKLSAYGNVTLNGEQALTHSRNRTIGNDFTRAERQREVLEAIMSKMSSIGSSNILNISDSLLKEVKTNINVMYYVVELTEILMNSDKFFNNIVSIQIPSTNYASGQTIKGVYYFVADADEMREDMINNIYKK